MWLNQKLSTKYFLLSQLIILIISLSFIFGLHYILNVQYQLSNSPFLGGPVTTAPKTLKLDLNHPQDLSLFFEGSILISGQTSSSKEVLIFTDSEDYVITSKKDGSFSTVINLDEGVNNITTVVFDSTGDFRSAQRTVYFSKEKI